MEEPVAADKGSRSSGGSEDKSLNGERTAIGEKKREGNVEMSIDEIRANKGSRRTTSLLNLFIPLSQGMLPTRAMCFIKFLSLQSVTIACPVKFFCYP